MSRIAIPASIADAPAASHDTLRVVEKQFGSIPNLFRILSNSPATLDGFVGLNSALARGELTAATRERVALALAEYHGCNYCVAAHSYIGQNLTKLSEEELLANREGRSSDAKADAAVKFALQVAKARGNIALDDFHAVRAAGYTDAAIIELIAAVALNVLTNYVNDILQTEIDFPAVKELAL